MRIKILGPGCKNCHALEERAREAVDRLGLDATIEEVTDYGEILAYGVMRTPGLVVDDQVVMAGHVPTSAAIAELLAAR